MWKEQKYLSNFTNKISFLKLENLILYSYHYYDTFFKKNSWLQLIWFFMDVLLLNQSNKHPVCF